MNADTWTRCERILARLLDLPASARDRHLDDVCRDDPEIRPMVERYLARGEHTGGFLRTPIARELCERAEGRSSNPSAPELGDHVGGYTILQHIGRGGMGTVYRVAPRQGGGGSHLALKLVHASPEDPSLPDRFRREIQILAELDHPNIVRLCDTGCLDEGRQFFVMELVQGERIDTYCARRELDVRGRLFLMLNVCAAVSHAHERRVLHRDLKPGNILVTPDGEPKLLDFGVAKVLGRDLSEDTRAGGQLVTPSYASPEQVFGDPVSEASDVYGLGVLLYVLLTGCLPREARAPTLQATMKQFEHSPDAPSQVVQPRPTAGAMPMSERRYTPNRGAVRRPFASDLDAIVLKAIRCDPHDRYPAVDHLATDLRMHLAGKPVAARMDGRPREGFASSMAFGQSCKNTGAREN